MHDPARCKRPCIGSPPTATMKGFPACAGGIRSPGMPPSKLIGHRATEEGGRGGKASEREGGNKTSNDARRAPLQDKVQAEGESGNFVRGINVRGMRGKGFIPLTFIPLTFRLSTDGKGFYTNYHELSRIQKATHRFRPRSPLFPLDFGLVRIPASPPLF